MNEVTAMRHKDGTHEYDALEPGTYFWAWKPEGSPLLRVEGGCVSLINGHLTLDAEPTAFFPGKKVWQCPDNLQVVIVVGAKSS